MDLPLPRALDCPFVGSDLLLCRLRFSLFPLLFVVPSPSNHCSMATEQWFEGDGTTGGVTFVSDEGEGGHGVAFLGVAGARPTVADVVAQFEPGDGSDGGIAVEVVVVRAHLDDVSPLLAFPKRSPLSPSSPSHLLHHLLQNKKF